MDRFVIDYLNSGKAWLLIGSGPSIEMGYPSWGDLATRIVDLILRETPPENHSRVETPLKNKNYPKVFYEAFNILGSERICSELRLCMVPTKKGNIYPLLAEWPINVYLTTNYDDEIQSSLTALGDAYLAYSNSEDHLELLTTDLTGAIYKLHGDLRSDKGLILTNTQYDDISNSEDWEYWRTKLTSVFQMNRVIVIGHSLTDPNITHVLKAAKQGAGVHQPICWIAPDISFQESKELLEKYRIRVIPYENKDGTHRNLLRVIENISQFIYPRFSIKIANDINSILKSPLGSDAAAPGFFVFNTLAAHEDFDTFRVDVMCAAIQAVLPKLKELEKPFQLEDAFILAGWPKDVPIPLDFKEQISSRVTEIELLNSVDNLFVIGSKAELISSEDRLKFEHSKGRFISSLVLRLRRNYPSLSERDSLSLAHDIDESLAGYFREGGLTLATTLLASSDGTKKPRIPSSVIQFLSKAASRYNDLQKRQAFITCSVDIFTQSEDAERDYLGRIAQGFFSFHALGIFGDAAKKRLQNAKDTVWLIDSSMQIPALALSAPTNAVFRDCIARLNSMNIRLVTTESLFDETREHFWFANKVIEENGIDSPYVLSAARGQPPYRKANQFLEGFIRWQSAGNPSNWETYLYKIFGSRNPKVDQIRNALMEIGIEVIPFESWPGHSSDDLEKCFDYTGSIARKFESVIGQDALEDPDYFVDYYKKAGPEAEVLVIVLYERSGRYYFLSKPNQESPAWFISHTSMLNLIEDDAHITWQPEAFLRFSSTLAPSIDEDLTVRAFDILLLAFSQVGISLLDDRTLIKMFGGVIDQAKLTIDEVEDIYNETLFQKYAESPSAVLERLSPIDRPIAALQLTSEMVQAEEQRRKSAEFRADAASKRAIDAERKLERLENVERTIEEKRRKSARKSRQRIVKKSRKSK